MTFSRLLAIILAIALALAFLSGCELMPAEDDSSNTGDPDTDKDGKDDVDDEEEEEDGKEVGDEEIIATPVPENLSINGERIPAYSGEAYYVVNGNEPFFEEEDKDIKGYYFTELDSLGRCGVAWGSIGPDTMPTDERESISHIYPSGWKYNGKSNNNEYPKETGVNGTIYNRAHLLANQLVANDVDKRNLITGTSAMNQLHMVKFENMVADYVKETDGHVLYRVTPYFEGKNLVCAGVLMEGLSLDDNGESVMFCVFIYNVQPGIYINYLTGENRLAGEIPEPTPTPELPYDIIEEPDPDTPYLLLGNYEDGVRYFSGEINKGLLMTDDRSLAADVYFIKLPEENNYHIYFIRDGVRYFISLTENSASGLEETTEPYTHWIFDPASGLFVTSREESHLTYGKRSLSLDPSRTDARAYYEGQVKNGTYEPLIVALDKAEEAN